MQNLSHCSLGFPTIFSGAKDFNNEINKQKTLKSTFKYLVRSYSFNSPLF